MELAPNRTRPNSNPTASLPSVALTNPALERIALALARQNRQLDAAFASVAHFADTSFLVNPELLEEIDAACATRPTTRGALVTLTRC